MVFTDPYVSRVYDDDTGKNGVFSLTLIGNNGTFEISPNVAERRASFLIRVRDNQYLDYERRHSVEFQVKNFIFCLYEYQKFTIFLSRIVDFGTGIRSSHKFIGCSECYNLHK